MIFKNWPDSLQGNHITITKTTNKDLVEFTSWRKWEGQLDITEEEGTFANQKVRVQKLKMLEQLDLYKELALSVFNETNELIALIELYLISLELYVGSILFKKSEFILERGYEAGKLLLEYIAKQDDSEVNSIFLDVQDYRKESISIIKKLGFSQFGYYYKQNSKLNWVRMLTFRL